jgi:hypothetical protein
MIFRAHTRVSISKYWHDVGFRGAVRLENGAERFWLDVHHDVGGVTATDDPSELIVISYFMDEPPVAAATVITDPQSHRARSVSG